MARTTTGGSSGRALSSASRAGALIELFRPVNGLLAASAVLVGAFVSRSPTLWWPAFAGAASAFAAAGAANALNDRLDVVPARQLDSLVRMGVAVHVAAEVGRVGTADLVLDGLIGYSLKGAPRGTTADLIRWANEQASPVLALDVPSGVDAGTGIVGEPAIRAAATLTLALAKRGLLEPAVGAQIGRLFVGDIGVPAAVYERFGIDPAVVARLFASKDVIAID